MFIFVSVTLLTFIIMEFVSWFTHKYVMHGFLWILHEDHHVPHKHPLEKNDAFFLMFAIPSSLLMIFGSIESLDVRFFVGLGILFYGIAYFLVHEVFIHQRLPWFKRTDNIYFRAIRKAHKVHHKHLTKEDGECFGMLLVPYKYFVEAAQSMKKSATSE